MNNTQFTGRLTKNPEAKYNAKGTKFVTFTLAVDDGYGENKVTDFIDCIIGGKIADTFEKYCKKGSKIFINGPIHIRNYTNPTTGQSVKFPQVQVETVEFLDSKPVGTVDNGTAVSAYQQPVQQPMQQPVQQTVVYPQTNGGYQQPTQPVQKTAQPSRNINVTEDDLPF